MTWSYEQPVGFIKASTYDHWNESFIKQNSHLYTLQMPSPILLWWTNSVYIAIIIIIFFDKKDIEAVNFMHSYVPL